MRRGRKCHYKNCDHHEGDKKSGRHCKFYGMPKDPITTRRWLHLGAVYHLTPKRVTPHNCFFCSCHFPNGKQSGPEEFIEECDWDDHFLNDDEDLNVSRKRSQLTGTHESPAVKTRRVDDLTPSTRLALDGLMSLADDHVSSPKSPRFSSKKLLWTLRGTQVRSSCRRTLCEMMDGSSTQGKGYKHSPDSSFPPSFLPLDENNNDDSSFKLSPTSTPAHSIYVGEFNHSNEDGSPITYEEALMSDLGVKPLMSTPPSSAPSEENGGQQQTNENNEMPTHRSVGIQCNRSFLSYDKCRMLKEKEFMFYTGVTQTVFEIIYNFIGGDEVCCNLKYEYKKTTPKKKRTNPDLTARGRMFLTLLRLRRGLSLADLKIVFNISKTHASRIAFTWIRLLSLQFSKLDAHMFTSASAQNELKPKCFEPFENLRIIIDATEFKIQHPRLFQQQSDTFSGYKKCNTVKFLVGISCFGGLSFLSDAYEGSITDRKLVEKSGLLDHLEPGEVVMADRGFDMEDLCDEKGLHLIIPAFPDGRTHFTAKELIYSRAIAVSRIHVETFIGMIKQFRLIRYVIPNKMLPIVGDIVKVCAYLVNFQRPFIKNDDDPEFE